MTSAHRPAQLRADARRNQERLLRAARDVFVELGPDAPLDAVARRAHVGIATLYRRFADRRALMRAVVLDTLGRVADLAQSALDEETDSYAALARYMHGALDVRVAAVMPVLVGHVPPDDEAVRRASDAATRPVGEIIRHAQAVGALRPEVTFGDIGLMLIRLSRPLPGPFPDALGEQLAHRHLEIVLAGLRSGFRSEPLPGRGLTLEALRSLAAEQEKPS